MKRKAFIGLLELLLVTVIVLFLFSLLLKLYFKPFSPKTDAGGLQGRDNNTYSTSQAVLDETKKKIDEINKEQLQKEKQMEQLLEN